MAKNIPLECDNCNEDVVDNYYVIKFKEKVNVCNECIHQYLLTNLDLNKEQKVSITLKCR